MTGLRFSTLLFLGAFLLPAQELRDYERKVNEFTLANGLHFIILERRQSPVVSFHTYVNAGTAEDPAGKTGVAGLLARLAFDGTETVGSKNWTAEKKLLEDVDAAYDRLDEERNKPNSSAGTVVALNAGVSNALGAAYVEQNPGEFLRAFRENGAVDIGCHATPDSIETDYSLPSNRIELWFLLESQRLAHPVFRDFFLERQKMTADSVNLVDAKSPARLRQSLLTSAFEDSPYRNPLLGWPADNAILRIADLKSFLETYSGPGNVVISIVGDVEPANVQRLAEKYFGPIPARPKPLMMHTQEVPQRGQKTVALSVDAQPVLMVGYKRPGQTHRDDAALDLIGAILGDNQMGWMRKELVDEKQLAQSVEVTSSFPSAQSVNLFVLTVVPGRDRTIEENRKALDDLMTRLQSKPVDADTLTRAKNLMRARFARILGSNHQLAALLATFYVGYGDWRRLFTVFSQYDHLTGEDLQRVALDYLRPDGRTVAYIANPAQAGNSTYVPGGLQ